MVPETVPEFVIVVEPVCEIDGEPDCVAEPELEGEDVTELDVEIVAETV